jgi:hypothetical protein
MKKRKQVSDTHSNLRRSRAARQNKDTFELTHWTNLIPAHLFDFLVDGSCSLWRLLGKRYCNTYFE